MKDPVSLSKLDGWMDGWTDEYNTYETSISIFNFMLISVGYPHSC